MRGNNVNQAYCQNCNHRQPDCPLLRRPRGRDQHKDARGRVPHIAAHAAQGCDRRLPEDDYRELADICGPRTGVALAIIQRLARAVLADVVTHIRRPGGARGYATHL